MNINNTNEVAIATRDLYRANAYRIISTYTRKERVNPADDESAFLLWLAQYASRVSYSTWRLYKASLVMEFRENYGNPRLSEMIRDLKVDHHKVHGIQTSTGKAKRISDRSLMAFEDYAKDSENVLNEPCLMCIKAGILCGLRPIEWAQSKILERSINEENDTCEFILEVKNAKATQGRSHGVFRTILFSGVSVEEFSRVEYMIHLGKRKDFPSLRARMSSRLSEVNNTLFGRVKGKNGVRENGIGLTLYSGRHQFAADAKAAKLTPYEIAAVMGHGSIDTAFNHYGRTEFGGNPFRARPYQRDLDQVERLNGGQARRMNRGENWGADLVNELEKRAQKQSQDGESHAGVSDES